MLVFIKRGVILNKIIVIFVIYMFTSPLMASGATSEYSLLSKEYHSFFKNKKNREQWLKLITKFEKHGQKYKKDNISAKSFYNVASLSYKLFKISHRQSDLNKTLNTYKNICLKYKKSSLADDSCAFLYQFYFKKIKNYEKSKFYAKFILENYKKGDNFKTATKFLNKNFPNTLKKQSKNNNSKVLKKISNNFLEIEFYKAKLIINIKSKHNETAKIGEVKVDGELKKVFIDLKNEHFKRLKPININFILKQIRFGQYKQDIGRIVFDFKNKAKYKVLDRGKTLLISFKNDDKNKNEIISKEIIKSNKYGHRSSATMVTDVAVQHRPEDDKKGAVQHRPEDKNRKNRSKKEINKSSDGRGGKATTVTDVAMQHRGDSNGDKNTNSSKTTINTGKKYIIIIDAGHGGKDPGAHRKKIYEKDIALAVALKLEKKLKKNKKYKVILTRRTDKFLTLDQRTDVANDNKGDIFISIHVNAIANSKFYGIETFYLNIAADNYSRRLESVENAENQKKISDLQFILADLLKKANTKESVDLASFVQSSLIFNLRRKYKYIKNLGVKNAMFYVLLDTKMPSILVELGFITNKRDFKRLLNKKYQDKLATSILKGIDKFFSKYKKRK